MTSLLHSVAEFAFAGTAWVAWSAAAAVSALIKRQSEESLRVRMSRKIAPVIEKAKWIFLASAQRSRRFTGKRPPPLDSDDEDVGKDLRSHGWNREREGPKMGLGGSLALPVGRGSRRAVTPSVFHPCSIRGLSSNIVG